MYVIRSGNIYHYLGNIYVQAYQNECGKFSRKKTLLNLCHLYFEKSAKILEGSDAIADYFDVQNDRLKFQITLFQGIQTIIISNR